MISSGPDDIWSPPEVVKILLIDVCKPLLGRRKCRAGEPGPGRSRGGLTPELLLTPLTGHIIILVIVIVVIKLVINLLFLRLILCLDYFIAFKYLRTRANAWNYWWLNSCRQFSELSSWPLGTMEYFPDVSKYFYPALILVWRWLRESRVLLEKVWSRSWSGVVLSSAVAVVAVVWESWDPVSGHRVRKHLSLDLNTIELDNDREPALQFVPFPELKISLGLEEKETGCWPRDRGEDILDFFLKMLRDLTVTSTGFWVVDFRNSLCSFLLFFTTNFFPFLSFITTFPILFDLAPKTSFSSDFLSPIDRLFSWRLSWRFWFLSFAILSICKAETKMRFSGLDKKCIQSD